MALAYLDAINGYSKSLSVSTNELVLMLLGTKLDLERIRYIESCGVNRIFFFVSASFQKVKVKRLQQNSPVPSVKQQRPMITNTFNNYFIELFVKCGKNANGLLHHIH